MGYRQAYRAFIDWYRALPDKSVAEDRFRDLLVPATPEETPLDRAMARYEAIDMNKLRRDAVAKLDARETDTRNSVFHIIHPLDSMERQRKSVKMEGCTVTTGPHFVDFADYKQEMREYRNSWRIHVPKQPDWMAWLTEGKRDMNWHLDLNRLSSDRTNVDQVMPTCVFEAYQYWGTVNQSGWPVRNLDFWTIRRTVCRLLKAGDTEVIAADPRKRYL